MASGDVKLSVKNKEDFDVVRAGFLFPAKAGFGGDSEAVEVTTSGYRVTEITACRYLHVTLLDVEGQSDDDVEEYGENLDVEIQDQSQEDSRSTEEKNDEANATQGAKDLANENDLDLEEVQGSMAGGRVSKADVEAHLNTEEQSITEGQAQTSATSGVVVDEDEAQAESDAAADEQDDGSAGEDSADDGVNGTNDEEDTNDGN